jgi:hypothetical protein
VTQAPLEVITNHSFFTGLPLIPSSMEKDSGYMQYTPATSEVGKAVSRALGSPGLNVADFSPIQFDQYVKGWTGTIGGDVLKALDIPYSDGKKPWELADIPFVGSFMTRNPGMSAQPIQEFYTQADKLEAKSNDFKLAMKRAEGGDPSEIDRTAADGQGYAAIAGIKDAINLQSHAIQGINANKEMTPAEKRQAIDALMPQMIQTAQQGVKAIEDLQEASKQADAPRALPTPPTVAPGAPAGRGGLPPPPAVPLPGANRGEVPIA